MTITITPPPQRNSPARPVPPPQRTHKPNMTPPPRRRAGALAFLLLAPALAALAGALALPAPGRGPAPRPPGPALAAGHGGAAGLPGAPIEQCEERWRTAALDHFGATTGPGGQTSFRQRFFVCRAAWDAAEAEAARPGAPPRPVFLYTGNEADVTLYLNATGLMWELAPEVGALLVFAEHRYYGRSKPFGAATRDHMQWLSSEQALADYATLIAEIRGGEPGAAGAPVVVFGGSYGGMLAAWLRIKYPHAVAGAVAGSAPIWAFGGLEPPYDEESFAAVVTRDATPAAGAAPTCAANIRGAFARLFARAGSAAGRREIAEAFALCDGVAMGTEDDALALAYWAQGAFDYIAMGNFPYASTYLLNGKGTLPEWPMRAACERAGGARAGAELLAGLREAVGLFYNSTGERACFDYTVGANPETDEDGDFWDFQACTEMVMPMRRDGAGPGPRGRGDMFFEQEWDFEAYAAGCKERWGVEPRPAWVVENYGGKDLRAASNIVFSNGGFDPWSTGGVLESPPGGRSLHAVFIPDGAHHLDFMFSHPNDTASVKRARASEREVIRGWIAEAGRAGPGAAASR